MKDNTREYHTIKFLRGNKRNNTEMLRLSEAQLDFDFRRLLIEESELDLHVYFSRQVVYNWLSWSFLALALCYLQHTIISSVLLGMAILSVIISMIYKRKFLQVFRSYNFALAILDMVIKQEHGLSLP